MSQERDQHVQRAMLMHLLGRCGARLCRVAIRLNICIAIQELHTFSRPAWVDSLSGGKNTKIFPTECHCPIQPPTYGREHWETALSCSVLQSPVRHPPNIPGSVIFLLWCLYLLTLDIVPECMSYRIICCPGGPEMPTNKAAPRVGDMVQHGVDLEKDLMCPRLMVNLSIRHHQTSPQRVLVSLDVWVRGSL